MLKDCQLFLVSGVKRARSSRAADSSTLPLIRYGTKILNLRTQEIGLLICIWKNKFADAEKLYLYERMSPEEIAEHLQVSRRAVYYWKKKFNCDKKLAKTMQNNQFYSIEFIHCKK